MPPGGAASGVNWSLRTVGGGALVQGVVTTDLPISNVMMAPHLAVGNGALASAVGVDFISMTLETDN